MSRYAAGTSVSVAKSRAEIEAIITRYGASRFASMTEPSRAVIMFEAHGRRVMFELPLPDSKAIEFWQSPARNRRRSPEDAAKLWEQACRQSWRALALVIKAKLEAVAAGITTFEDEFLAHILLPDGKTVGRWMGPQLEAAYANGRMPPLLPAGGSP